MKGPSYDVRGPFFLRGITPRLSPATTRAVAVGAARHPHRRRRVPPAAHHVWIRVVLVRQYLYRCDHDRGRIFPADFLASGITCHLRHALVADAASEANKEGDQGKTGNGEHETLLVKMDSWSPDWGLFRVFTTL